MVKWTLFRMILLVKVLEADVLDEDYDDTTKLEMEPKTKSDVSTKYDSTNDLAQQDISYKTKDKVKGVKDINCIDFSNYATNCTVGAALLYNSPRVTPPLSNKLRDWCKSILHLTNCALDWNTECNESTDSLFHDDSIKGHMHVVDNICNDEWFISQYQHASKCIESAASSWEDCYEIFKVIVEEQKNITREWTHYETHFYLCCAQAQFRRCTLDFLFKLPDCPYEDAVTLQKFSIIISQGDVFQECDGKILYANCPNGDPSPTQHQLKVLMDNSENLQDGGTTQSFDSFVLLSTQSLLLNLYLYCLFCI